MPEGDTIFRAARTLNRALAGETVTEFETAYAHLSVVDDQTPIAGRTVERVEARGKHMLMVFSGALILRTHMRMSGSWHIYRPGERWQMGGTAMRVRVQTTNWVAVAFNVMDAEFVETADLRRHTSLNALGPDLLGEDWDEAEALRRLRARGGESIVDAILNQRVVAGIGNVYKSESLFLAGVHPATPVNVVSDEKLRELLRVAGKLMRANIATGAGPGIVTYGGLRRTTSSTNPTDRLWVYGRREKPCRKCGTPIVSKKMGPDARSTYWCPTCQAQGSGTRDQGSGPNP